MAERKSSTSAPNSDRGCSSSSVSAAREGISRRDAMNMMATVAAVPLLAGSRGSAEALSYQANTFDWDRARDAFLKAKRDQKEVDRRYRQAWRRYYSSRPTLDPNIKRDLPGIGWGEGGICSRDLDRTYRQFCDGEGRGCGRRILKLRRQRLSARSMRSPLIEQQTRRRCATQVATNSMRNLAWWMTGSVTPKPI